MNFLSQNILRTNSAAPDTFLTYCSTTLCFEVPWQYLVSWIEFGIAAAHSGSDKVGWFVFFHSGSFRHQFITIYQYIRILKQNRVNLFQAGQKLYVDIGYHLPPC
jgi:hypothetical protein